jgi:cell division protein FtsQ
MSDVVYSVGDDFDFIEKTPVEKDKRITVIKFIVVILTILLLLELVISMVVLPGFAPGKVIYSGLRNFNEGQMNTLLGDMTSSTWVNFDSEKAVSLLSTVPGIESVSIEKRFPDKILVQVTERVPVAKTIVSVNNRTIPIQIDKNGVLFPITSDSIISDSSLPLISGLPIDTVKNNMRLPEKYRTLMEQIGQIRSLPQKYFVAVSEIRVMPKEYGNFELVLYPINSRVKVLTDRSLNEDAFKYMMVVLDVVNSIEPDVSLIDLRYGSVSYTKR